jgi:uncharacterized membrane-anchored protein YitT (DUF2179 family)
MRQSISADKLPSIQTTTTGRRVSRPSAAPAVPAPKRALRRAVQALSRLLLMLIGVLVTSLSYSLFQVPYDIAAGGVGGIAIILNHFTGWPVGTMYLLMNIPLLILGFFHLGRWSFVLRTVLAVVVFSVATDLFIAYLPGLLAAYPVTKDVLLSAVYAGLVGGVGGGLVYRSGSTMGGTGIIGRIVQKRTGAPLSQVYL